MGIFNATMGLTMSHYEESKKVRRAAAIIYLLIMAFILVGTYLSEQEKAEQKALQDISLAP